MTSIPVNGTVEVSITVNGQPATINVAPRLTLADAIRDELRLTGTHLGCESGACGACTVLVNGEPARSCLMLAVQADGESVITVEGLTNGEHLHPIQTAMAEAFAFQCGFCTPGFLISTVALLRENNRPTREEIREELGGNLCRCTGYESIIAGVEKAIESMGASSRASTSQSS